MSFHLDLNATQFRLWKARKYDVQIDACELMPNHWHLVLIPKEARAMSQFLRWVTATHPMRYHAHDHTSGEVSSAQ